MARELSLAGGIDGVQERYPIEGLGGGVPPSVLMELWDISEQLVKSSSQRKSGVMSRVRTAVIAAIPPSGPTRLASRFAHLGMLAGRSIVLQSPSGFKSYQCLATPPHYDGASVESGRAANALWTLRHGSSPLCRYQQFVALLPIAWLPSARLESGRKAL